MRDVGSKKRFTVLRSENAAAAPPLSQGMWVAYIRSTEEPGREKDEEEAKEWEAQVRFPRVVLSVFKLGCETHDLIRFVS